MQKNNYLEANAENFIGRFRMLTAGIFLFFSCTSAWAVTEKEIMAADPRRMLKGIMKSCDENNERIFFTYFTVKSNYSFSKISLKSKAELFHIYCRQLVETLKPLGPVDVIKIFVMKRTPFFPDSPAYALCMLPPNQNKVCRGRGGIDIDLENGHVKIDKH
jgi:hypothetical protein